MMDEESRAKRLRQQAEAKLQEMQGQMEKLPRDVQELIHELQVHRIELEMQNEALREAQQRREEALRLYTDLYDFAPVGYLDLDKEGRIERANLTASVQLGGEGKLTGRSFYEFIHRDDRDVLFQLLREVLRSREQKSCEVRHGEKDACFRLESVFFPISDNEALCRTSITDITEGKRAERKLKEAHDHLEQRVRERTAEIQCLSRQLLSAQDKERKRVSHELHDGVGQSIAALKFTAEDAFAKLPEDSLPQVKGSILKLVRIVQGTLDELRRIEKDLWPPTLEILGLVPTIQVFCRDAQGVYGLEIKKHLEIEEGKIPDILKIVVFRIVQEAVHNAIKHSGSKEISIGLEGQNAKLDLTVRDRGKGFDLDKAAGIPREGIGLQSMRERAELSGGKFSIDSAPGKGTTVRATWKM